MTAITFRNSLETADVVGVNSMRIEIQTSGKTVLKIQLHSVQPSKIFWFNNNVYFALSVTELCFIF